VIKTKENSGRKKRRFPLIQVVMIAAVLGLIWYGFGRYVLAPAQSSAVPEYIGPLKLVSHVEGPEALTEINKLHGASISLQNAFIADYSGIYGGDHVKVWAGSAGSRDAAAELIDRMVKGINRGGTGFNNLKQIKVAGLDVWQADGAGGNFFFYISLEPADRVVWLTIDSMSSISLIESAIKVF
jgi:hypothetical protein